MSDNYAAAAAALVLRDHLETIDAEDAALKAVYHGLNPAEVERTAEALDDLIANITTALNAHVGAMITA